MTTWAVVPVREDSRRLPGKALLELDGRPLFAHVVERAARSRVDRVVVATDSVRVKRVCEALGQEVLLTDAAPCGTHRVWAAVRGLADPPDQVVNVQGDQPRLEPAHVDAAVALLDSWEVATVCAPLADATPVSKVKVVRARDGRALYFSRAPVPWGGPHFLHVGVYAFRFDALRRCVAAPRDGLATTEDLEQLAWLESGIAIGVVEVPHADAAVDEETDLNGLHVGRSSSGAGTGEGTG